MANVKTFSPSQISMTFGGIPVTGLAATTDAVSFSTIQPPAGLTIGLGSACKVNAAAVSFGMKMKVLASDPVCTLLDALRRLNMYGNNNNLPGAAKDAVSAAANEIPFTFVPHNNLAFTVITTAWVCTNSIDLDLPFVGSSDFYREFTFEILDEVQNLMGALYTSNN